MWNPFQKKPDTFLESIKHHFMHESIPTHRVRNISLGILLWVLIISGILWKSGQQDTPPPPNITEQATIVSGEEPAIVIQENTPEEDAQVAPGEICMKKPDIFIFTYTQSGTMSTGSVYEHLRTIQDFAKKGAIVLLDKDTFDRSAERWCFTWNPIWLLWSTTESTQKMLASIAQEHEIPLFTIPLDQDSLTPYSVKKYDITSDTRGDFFREILQEYLEIESGGFFRDIQ
jgi:hypothetical protein